MVIMLGIGQSAYLLSKSVMLAYDRVSETERIWVDNECVNSMNRLKIQSIPLGKLNGREVLRLRGGS